MSRAHTLLCALALASAWSSGCAEEIARTDWPADCAGLSGAERLRCGDARFWQVHTRDYEAREETYALIDEILATTPEGVDDVALSQLHFRQGALGLELALEHGRGDVIEAITPHLAAAARLDPENPKVPPWVDAMDLVRAFARGDAVEFEAVVARLDTSVARYPTGNVLSITGTMSGFPLSTGLPQRAVTMLEAWSCDEDWCRHNTERAPFSQPGLEVHFADAYARVGDVERTRAHLERALVAQDAEVWPHRDFAQDALADVEGYVERFTSLGEEGSAVSLVYANGERGCRICHGTR